MRAILLVSAMAVLSGCGTSPAEAPDESGNVYSNFNERLATVYQSKPDGTARAYALIKEGPAGPDWLATIHGYGDNRWTCEELIKPYNEDPSLSVFQGRYYCQEL